MDALTNLFNEDPKKAKKKKVYSKKLSFNLLQFPSPSTLSICFILFVAAGVLLFASNIVPQFNRDRVKESVIDSIRTFELEDEVNGGLFSFTNRKGDTQVNNCKSKHNFIYNFFLKNLLYPRNKRCHHGRNHCTQWRSEERCK